MKIKASQLLASLLIYLLPIAFFQTVEAAWKNLCPEQALCPILHRGTVNTTLAGIDSPPGKILNGGVALPYPKGLANEGIRTLLSYSDKTAFVPISYDTRRNWAIMQHTSGNWIGVANEILTVFDASGKQINFIDLKSPEPLFQTWTHINGTLYEVDNTVFFLMSGLTFDLYISHDAGMTFNKSGINIIRERGLTPNLFDTGFFVIGQHKMPRPPSGSQSFEPAGLYSIPKNIEMLDLQERTHPHRVDDLQPLASFDAIPNAITLDPNSINSDKKVMYAATNKGLFISHDAGRSWSPVSTMTGPISSIAIVHDQQPKLILVTTADGVLASRDNGTTWTSFALGLYPGEHRVYYTQGQLLIRGQGGWYRCVDFKCDGKASSTLPSGQTDNTIPVVEFYNADLDHYFITSNPEEITGIDNGSAGSGWTRTGYEFSAWPLLGHPGKVGKPVCRFYGSPRPGPNSHFFSLSPNECEWLHSLQKQTPDNQPRWNFEGFAFEVEAIDAENGHCRSGRIPVYRAYNNGFALGKDANHRFVPNQEAIDKLIAQGWINEGIAFCVDHVEFTAGQSRPLLLYSYNLDATPLLGVQIHSPAML